MFTGIVERVGKVKSVAVRGGGRAVQVESGIDAGEIALGESIAVNGVCLTVIGKGGVMFEVEVSPETLGRSNLKYLKRGDPVNIERSLKVGDRMGGHMMYGHVDGVATIRRIRKYGDSVVFEIDADNTIMRYIVLKGSVAVQGVSLTVSKVARGGFEVTLLPYTLENTTLTHATQGALVNIEVDIIGKYIENLLAKRDNSGILELLGKSGYVKED